MSIISVTTHYFTCAILTSSLIKRQTGRKTIYPSCPSCLAPSSVQYAYAIPWVALELLHLQAEWNAWIRLLLRRRLRRDAEFRLSTRRAIAPVSPAPTACSTRIRWYSVRLTRSALSRNRRCMIFEERTVLDLDPRPPGIRPGRPPPSPLE